MERILRLADQATERNATFLPEFITALADPHPVVRYWGATGCLILKEKAAPAKTRLQSLLTDSSADVRVVAAESIACLGEREAAATIIAGVLKTGNPHEVLAAQNTLEYMWKAGHITLAKAKRMAGGRKLREPDDSIPDYLLAQP